MEITWISLAKIIVAGLMTYIFLPLFLMIRDLLLWKAIRKFLLTDNLRIAIKRKARLTYEWNSEHAVKSQSNKNGCFIDGNKVTEKEFSDHLLRGEQLSKQLRELDLFIQSRSRVVGLLLNHYKHTAANPIPTWFESEYEIIEKISDR